jgi:NAD(P)-dependent dehydrogenase (short-subunit alcohol dehydrogenase family)
MQSQEHEGEIAVITGGGRGFGKAFGHALAARGAHVVLVDLDGAAGELAAAEIISAGGSASSFAADVADEDQVAAVMGDTVEQFGGIDFLINNAGLHSQAYNEPMRTSGVDKIRRLFDVNLMGTVICTLAARDAMVGRAHPAIVNISSMASYGCQTAYGVSKLAVRGLTASFAHELGAEGIRVNALAPGLIFTDTIRAELAPETVAYVLAQQILEREGLEDDIVGAMLFLVSSNAAFITGETLRVSGGATLAIG